MLKKLKQIHLSKKTKIIISATLLCIIALAGGTSYAINKINQPTADDLNASVPNALKSPGYSLEETYADKSNDSDDSEDDDLDNDPEYKQRWKIHEELEDDPGYINMLNKRDKGLCTDDDVVRYEKQFIKKHPIHVNPNDEGD